MKCTMNIHIKSVIFSVLILQTSASFFDGVRGAFETVENSFGKLFNDVVYDVSVTIDCTLMAVQQVFSFGGVFSRPSEYEERCNGKTGQSEQRVPPPTVLPPEVRHDNYAPTAKPRAQDAAEISHGIAGEVKKQLSQELNATMSNVNQTINNFFNISSAHKDIENVQSAIKNETDRLAEMNALLNQDIDDLSGTAKTRLKNDVLKEVKLLQDTETSSENKTETSEIREMLDEVLDELQADDDSETLLNNDEVEEIVKDTKKVYNDTFTDIEKDGPQWKKEENKTLENIETKIDDVPKTFKDVAKKLFEQPVKSIGDTHIETTKEETTDSKTTDKEISATDVPESTKSETEISPSESATEIIPDNKEQSVPVDQPVLEEPTDLSKLDPSVINSFFGPPPSEEARKEAVKDAEKLIEQSKFTNTIMNNFFNRPREDDDVLNIFDNPDLLNFGDDY